MMHRIQSMRGGNVTAVFAGHPNVTSSGVRAPYIARGGRLSQRTALLPSLKTCSSFAYGAYRRPRHGLLSQGTRPRTQLGAAPDLGEAKIETVRRFYEQGWASDDPSVLDTLVAEDHVQADKVWQAQEKVGRESMKHGIGIIRRWYPDISFSVEDAVLSQDGQKVFARWTMSGTFEGEKETSHGLSLLTVDDSRLITRSEVFRQATRAEAALAQKSEGAAREAMLQQGPSPS